MIVLLDNGLRNLGEHSFQLVTAVSAEIRARGLRCEIYGYRGLSADVAARTGARRHFRDSLYVGRLPGPLEILKQPSYLLQILSERHPIHSETRTARLTNRHFRDDLAALPAATWDPGSIVVFPAMTQNQILGLADFLAGRDAAHLPKIVCQLMMDITWTPWGGAAAYGQSYYRCAFERLQPFAPVLRLTAENAVLAGSYRDAFGVEVGELPVPFSDHARRRERTGTVRLGFFGYSKTEKGFNLLPDAIRHCRAAGVDAAFVIQIQHGGWEAETLRTEKELRAIAGVTLIEGEMDSTRYVEVTNDVDVTLLPYDPLRFGVRGSGLLTEAISAGRPVIATEGLYAAIKIADGSAAGEIFAPYTGVAMAEAIGRLVRRIAEAKAQADLLAGAFAPRHSSKAYVDALLAL